MATVLDVSRNQNPLDAPPRSLALRSLRLLCPAGLSIARMVRVACCWSDLPVCDFAFVALTLLAALSRFPDPG